MPVDSKSRLTAFHRSMVPKQKAMIQRYNNAVGLIDGGIPTTLDECEAVQQKVETAIEKLTESIKAFEAYDAEWLQHLAEIEDDAQRKTEEALYETKAVEEKEGYLGKIELCRDRRCELEALSKAIERRVKSLNQRTDSSTASGSEDRRTGNNRRNPSDRSQTIRAKLPKITLPVFDGKDIYLGVAPILDHLSG